MSTVHDQIELTFAAPEVSPAEIDALCAWLRGRGWVRAAVIEQEFGIDDRKLRVIGEHSDGRLLTGQKGHRLNDETATVEEVDRSALWKISQGKKMIRRGLAERRHHHRLGASYQPSAVSNQQPALSQA